MADTQKETDPAKYPGYLGVGYPDVFTTIPSQPTEKKPGQLLQEKVREYFEKVSTSYNLKKKKKKKKCKIIENY